MPVYQYLIEGFRYALHYFCIKMKLIYAINIEDSVTVAYLRTVTELAGVDTKSDYLVSPVLLEHNSSVLSDIADKIRFDTCLVKWSELQAPFNYRFYTEMTY